MQRRALRQHRSTDRRGVSTQHGGTHQKRAASAAATPMHAAGIAYGMMRGSEKTRPQTIFESAPVAAPVYWPAQRARHNRADRIHVDRPVQDIADDLADGNVDHQPAGR